MAPNFNLTSSEAVAKLEEFFQRPLPEDYAWWLVEPDAVYPALAEVPIPGNSPRIDRIEMVYAPQHILQTLHEDAEMVRQGKRPSFPRGTIPFGESYRGNYYLLSMRDEDHGSVLFMDHKTADPHNDFQKGLITLAESFETWLSALRLDPQGKEGA